MRIRDWISDVCSFDLSIVHFQAYDGNGVPSDDPGIYAAVIEGIRSEVDAIVYPTIAFEGDDRYVFVEALARQGLLEWASLDTGSLNLSRFSDIEIGRAECRERVC